MLRYLIFLSAFLLLAGPPAFAQSAGLRLRPERADDMLVLTLPDADRAAWQRVGRLLAQRGYPIRYASPELQTLTTETIIVENIGKMGLLAVVDGHELRLQAYIPMGENDSAVTWFVIANQGRLLGGSSRYWQELEAVARLLGGTVQYTRSINN